MTSLEPITEPRKRLLDAWDGNSQSIEYRGHVIHTGATLWTIEREGRVVDNAITDAFESAEQMLRYIDVVINDDVDRARSIWLREMAP